MPTCSYCGRTYVKSHNRCVAKTKIAKAIAKAQPESGTVIVLLLAASVTGRDGRLVQTKLYTEKELDEQKARALVTDFCETVYCGEQTKPKQEYKEWVAARESKRLCGRVYVMNVYWETGLVIEKK